MASKNARYKGVPKRSNPPTSHPTPKSDTDGDRYRMELERIRSKIKEGQKLENKRLEEATIKFREQRLAIAQPMYAQIKKELQVVDSEGTTRDVGLDTIYEVHRLLSAPSPSPSPSPTSSPSSSDIPSSSGKDFLSSLAEDTIVFRVIYVVFISRIDEFRIVEDWERYCYAKHAVNRVGINYEKARSMQQKAFYSGDYELVKTVAELAWLGLEPFEPAESNIKVALLALAIVPKKNYLTSLPYVWGLVYEQYAGNDCNLPRNYANSIVAMQPKNYINDLFGQNMENPSLQELLACVVGELIVQNIFPPAGVTNNVTKYYEKMVANKHPLTDLPCRVLAIESGARPSMVTLTGRGSYGFAPPNSSALFSQLFPSPRPMSRKLMLKNAYEQTRRRFHVKDVTTLENMVGLTRAIHDFSHYECRIFEVQNLSRPLDPRDIIPVLIDGGAACLQGLGPADYEEEYLTLLTAFRAFGTFFGLAANGNCYSECWAGAYARAEAWKTLAAVVGVPYSVGIEEIEKEAKKCHYLYIYVSNDNCWFERCAHNVALGILRADKKTVVIHAISDSD